MATTEIALAAAGAVLGGGYFLFRRSADSSSKPAPAPAPAPAAAAATTAAATATAAAAATTAAATATTAAAAAQEDKHEYDVVLHANSLRDIHPQSGQRGWRLTFREETFAHEVDNVVVVAALGCFNRGKSWIINRLAGVNLPSGQTISTEGISFLLHSPKQEAMLGSRDGVANRTIAYLDSAGSQQPRKFEDIVDAQATENWCLQFAVETCHDFFVVFEQLTRLDQEYLQALTQMLPPERRQHIHIVHNFSKLETLAQVEEAVNKDILDKFSGAKWTRQKQGDGHVDYLRSDSYVHVIMAREGTDAGNKFNQASFDFLSSKFLATATRRDGLQLIRQVEEFASHTLRKYFPALYRARPGKIVSYKPDEKVFSLCMDAEEMPRGGVAYSPALRFTQAGFAIESKSDGEVYAGELNITATEDQIFVELFCPGLDPASIEVQLETRDDGIRPDSFIVSGKRFIRAGSVGGGGGVGGGGMHQRMELPEEVSWKELSRRVTIPSKFPFRDLDEDESGNVMIDKEYRNGVIVITLNRWGKGKVTPGKEKK